MTVLKTLTFVLILATFGCTTVAVEPDLPCPNRPFLEGLTMEELNAMLPTSIKKVTSNQINLVGYARKLEIRAGCNDT
jgi:hypothetical protein